MVHSVRNATKGGNRKAVFQGTHEATIGGDRLDIQVYFTLPKRETGYQWQSPSS